MGYGIYLLLQICLFVLDICCQHLGNTCQLEIFCAPFGRRVRECIFCNEYICIRYMLPRFGGYMSVGGFPCALWAQGMGMYILLWIYLYWIYAANIWGIYVSWRFSVRLSDAGLGNVHFVMYIFVLDICFQPFGEYMSVECICWYWIYHANT